MASSWFFLFTQLSCSCVVYLLTRRICLCFRVMWRIRESSNSCFSLFLFRWPQTWLQFAARNNTAAVVCTVHVTHWLANVRVGHELSLSKWSTHTQTHVSDSFVVLNQRITVNFYDNFFSESSARTVIFTFVWSLLSPYPGSGDVEFAG